MTPKTNRHIPSRQADAARLIKPKATGLAIPLRAYGYGLNNLDPTRVSVPKRNLIRENYGKFDWFVRPG